MQTIGLLLLLGLVLDEDQGNGNQESSIDGGKKELIGTALSCAKVMSRICNQTIEQFRGEVAQDRRRRERMRMLRRDDSEKSFGGHGDASDTSSVNRETSREEEGNNVVDISKLVEHLRTVVGPYPKKVPITIDVANDAPEAILGDDLKIFRSALNYDI